MEDHQAKLQELEWAIVDVYAELHGQVKSLRYTIRKLLQDAGQVEDWIDEEMGGLLRRVRDAELEAQLQLPIESTASDR